MRNFGTLEIFLRKFEKKSPNFSKIRDFVRKKKFLWFCSKLAQMRFKQYKFIQIWNIPNSDFSNWKKVKFSFFVRNFWFKNTKEERPFFGNSGSKIPTRTGLFEFLRSVFCHLREIYKRIQRKKMISLFFGNLVHFTLRSYKNKKKKLSQKLSYGF